MQLRTLEVLGLAGTGKTTISKEFAATSDSFQYRFKLSRRRWPLHFARQWFFNSPCLLRTGFGTQALNEFCDRVYVATLFDAIDHMGTSHHAGVVFDQGPLFRLARMCLLRRTRWWTEAIRRWSGALHLVVWLDAPEELLLERVRTRSKPHRMKSVSHERGLRLLAEQRAQYREILGALRDLGRVPIVEIDTSNSPIDSCVEQIRSACDP